MRSFFIACFVIVAFGCAAEAQTRRVALVIGNAKYQHGSVLGSPERDAESVGSALKRIGFDVVLQSPNMGSRAMSEALSQFRAQARGADVALIYYSGHGVEIEGINYLIPVDAKLEDPSDAGLQAISLPTVMRQLDGARKLRVVILDACRDNPFQRRLAQAPGSKSLGAGKGLIAVNEAELGDRTLIAFAAGAGTVAEDRPGKLSTYTESLLKHLESPELEILKLFGKVRDDVMQSTSGKQRPHVYQSLGGESVFLMPDRARLEREGAARREWEKLQTSRNFDELYEFAKRHNGAPEALEAIDRIRNLNLKDKEGQVVPPQATGGASDRQAGTGQGWVKWAMNYFSPKKPGGTSSPAAPEPPKVSPEERFDWQVALHVDTSEAYTTFLETWPSSTYRGQAEAAIAREKKDGRVTPQQFEKAVVLAGDVVRSNRADFRKSFVKLEEHEDDNTKIDVCRKDKQFIAAMRGFSQVYGFYSLTLSALKGIDLKTSKRKDLFEEDEVPAPRGLLKEIGAKGLPTFLSNLRGKMPATLLNSPDIKILAQVLLNYKTSFDKKVDAAKLREIDMETYQISRRIGDPNPANPCFKFGVTTFLGVDKEPKEDDQKVEKDDDPPVMQLHESNIHDYFYAFWYRRQIEGTADLVVMVLKRIVAS